LLNTFLIKVRQAFLDDKQLSNIAVIAIAGGSDAYEATGSQGRRMTDERWWNSFSGTARSVADLLPVFTQVPGLGDLVQGNNSEHEKEEIC